MDNDSHPVVPPKLQGVYPYYIDANGHFDAHSHDYHELVVIQRGQLRVKVACVERIAGPGDIVLYPAGIEHEEWALDGEPVLTWVCAFYWEGLDNNGVLFYRDSQGHVQELLAKLAFFFLLAHFSKTPDPEFYEILSQILEELKTRALPLQAMVDRVQAYIHAHMAEPFTLDDLAGAAQMSKFHFVRHYRVVTGRTPMEDVRFLRVEEARRLIKNTSLPLYEIAPQVGIANEHHLSRLLKSLLGVSARELR